MTLGKFILFTSAKVVLDQRPYFEKYARTSVQPANFRTSTVKYGRVGRSVPGAGRVATKRAVSLNSGPPTLEMDACSATPSRDLIVAITINVMMILR